MTTDSQEALRKSSMYSKLKSSIAPLKKELEDETSKTYAFIKSNSKALHSSLLRDLEVLSVIGDLLDEIKKITNLKIRSLLNLFYYLGLVESVGIDMIDNVLILLIACGHDIHIERRYIEHVSCFEDLEKIELWKKLEFLEEHDLKPVASIFDRRLRNRIAHINFIIEDDGTVKTKEGSPIDIYAKISSLQTNLMCLNLVTIDIELPRIIDKMIEENSN